jgi:glycine oxidase
VNVTVVGAGVIGYAIAYELGSRDARVRIIDRRGVGKGATRASAGVLAPYIEGHLESLLRLGVGSLQLYKCFIQRLRSDSQQPVEYELAGTLQVARDERESDDLEAAAQRLTTAQMPHTLINGASARQLEPMLADGVRAALLVPGHGYVAAGALMAALHTAAASRGVSVVIANVEQIEYGADGIRLVTSDGAFDTDAVVIAAGSWSGQLPMPAPPPVRPIRGQLLHLRFSQRVASRVIWGTQCYMVPWEDGSLLLGATIEDVGFDEEATVAGVRQLLDRACELAPVVATARLHEVRVGLRPATPDELPVIGASSTMRGVFYATGHYRNGVLLAPLTAKLIADLILDGRKAPDLELTRPERFGL